MEYLFVDDENEVFMDARVFAFGGNLNRKSAKKFVICHKSMEKLRSRAIQPVSEIPNLHCLDVYHNLTLQRKLKGKIPKRPAFTLRKRLKAIFSRRFGNNGLIKSSKFPDIFRFFPRRVILAAMGKLTENIFAPIEKSAQTKILTKKKLKLDRLVKKISKQKLRKFKSLSQLCRKTQTNYGQIRYLFRSADIVRRVEIKLENLYETGRDLQNCFRFFRGKITDFRRDRFSILQMYEFMARNFPIIRQMSKNRFYTIFFKKVGLKFARPRGVQGAFCESKKIICRRLTTFLIERILAADQELLFYDESTVQLTLQTQKSWFFPWENRSRTFKVTNKFLKLGLISSMEGIIAFSLTFGNASSSKIANFVRSAVAFYRKQKRNNGEIFLLMDNGPKNRSVEMNEAASLGLFRIIFSTPTTPQHNFVESLFYFVKKNIRRLYSKNDRDGSFMTKVEMVQKVLMSLKSLSPAIFAKARKMYLHDLRRTMEGLKK